MTASARSGDGDTHWRLSLWYFVYFAFVGAYLPYFSLYLESAGFSAARIAVLMSLGQIMRLVAPTFWGWLSDRSGRRTTLIRMSAALSMISFAGYFLTRDFALLIVISAVLHLFWSAALPLVEALTFSHLRHAPERYGRIRLWGSVGFVVAVAGIGVWLDYHPIESLLVIAWLILMLALVAAWSLRDEIAFTHEPADDSASLREPRVLALLAAGFFMAAAHGALYIFYSIHLVGNGYGKSVTGVLWSLGVFAEIAVFMYWPRLGQRLSLRTVLLACLALAVIRFLMIGWWVDILLLLVVAQVLHGATFGAHHVASVAALNKWFLPRQQGRVQALYGSLSFGGGGMAGGLMAGQTWQSAGAGVTFSLSAGLAAIGFFIVYFLFSENLPRNPSTDR